MNKDLTKALRQVDSITKSAKMRMAMSSNLRTEAYVNTVFGIPGGSELIIPDWYQKLEQKTKERKQQLTKHYEQGTATVISPDSSGTTTPIVHLHEQPSNTARSDATQPEDVGPTDSVYKSTFPDQRAVLLTQTNGGCNQVGVAKTLFDNIFYKKMLCQQLIAQAGAGKTFVLGSVIKNLVENGFTDSCCSPWPILYVTKASVVDQTKGVLNDLFNIDMFGTVQVINIEQLRSSLLGTLIEKDIDIREGEEHERYIWRDGFQPVVILWDESQGLARSDSTQSKVANALITSPRSLVSYDTYQIDSSATPWSRVSEAKHLAVSSRKVVDMAGGRVMVTSDNWPMIAREIAHPSDPTDHCTAAIKRFVDVFEDRIIRISGIRPEHKSHNSVLKIDFPTQELRDEYTKAVENFDKKSAKIKSDDTMTEQQKAFATLAEFTIFRKAAENCRREFMAEWAHNTWHEGFAPGLGFSFKQTGSSICRILIEKYKWTRQDITIIWGGATEALNNKKKIARKINESEQLRQAMTEAGISLEDDLGIYLDELQEKTAEQLAFEKAYRLLSQKPQEREAERIAFQRQISKVAMFSYKSGGVGLSLHHESLYPDARPRKGLFTPVYSEKELVQALGRFPRITSISDTEQIMCYYAGTIEEHVAAKVIKKLKCLREAIRGHESWEELITKMPKRSLPQYEKHTMMADNIEELNTEAEEVAMLSGE